jgi:hypothetical protein
MRHGPRRLWYAPWAKRCPRGPSCPDCLIERTINAPMTSEQLYDAGIEYARLHESDERRRRRGAR